MTSHHAMKNIAILGAGRIGSAFAFHLARAGHQVTVVARGARLADLQRDLAIVDVDGRRSAVMVAGELDPTVAFDAVLFTVLAHQLDAALPALSASSARSIVFLLNTFEPLDRPRDAVGRGRAVFGFPAIVADYQDGKLRSQIDLPGQGVTLDDEAWAGVFEHAGFPPKVERDMQSWLRSHAAAMAPLMTAGRTVSARGRGLTWREARRHAAAVDEGFAVVRALDHRVIPAMHAVIAHMPRSAKAAILWSLSRSRRLGSLGDRGPGEPRALIDAMIAAAPAGVATNALRAIRP